MARNAKPRRRPLPLLGTKLHLPLSHGSQSQRKHVTITARGVDIRRIRAVEKLPDERRRGC